MSRPSLDRSPQTIWVDTPERWDRLAEALLTAGEAGYDSETYNQPYKTSPQHRAKLHHWSVAVLTNKCTARNYHRARGFALPREALDHPALYDALRSITLWGHNGGHDEHTARNEGLDLVVNDTLQWSRVLMPGMSSYSLKSKGQLVGIETWALGKDSRDGFKELTAYEAEVTEDRRTVVQRCICGRVPCRSKSTSDWFDEEQIIWRPHNRVPSEVVRRVTRTAQLRYEVTDFGPDHPRWIQWLAYVIADAESAIELVDWMRRRYDGREAKRYPWVSNHL